MSFIMSLDQKNTSLKRLPHRGIPHQLPGSGDLGWEREVVHILETEISALSLRHFFFLQLMWSWTQIQLILSSSYQLTREV